LVSVQKVLHQVSIKLLNWTFQIWLQQLKKNQSLAFLGNDVNMIKRQQFIKVKSRKMVTFTIFPFWKNLICSKKINILMFAICMYMYHSPA
jgi:hypothetical protein